MKALEFFLSAFWVVSFIGLIWGIADGTPAGNYAIQISITPFVVLSVFFILLFRDKKNEISATKNKRFK